MSHKIDRFAYTNRLRWLPPRHKLGLAIVLLLLSLISGPIVQCLITLWLVVWVVVYAGIPAQFYGGLLLLPIGFWLMSFPAFVLNAVSVDQIAAVQFDACWGRIFGNFYLYVSQVGLHQVGLLLVRVLASTSSMYFILLTIPFTEVLQVLRQLHLPALLIELLLLMYRFIFTLWAIADELWTAQNSRCGYRTWRRGMTSLGILVGQLLQRSLLSYRQVCLSLDARGFNGELRFWAADRYVSSRRYSIEATIGCMGLILLNWGLRHAGIS